MARGEIRSVPQTAVERLLGSLGEGTSKARGFLNENVGLPFVDTGIGFGDVMIGEAPEMLSEMSWGKSPVIPSGHGGRLDPRLVDIAGVAGIAGAAKAPAKKVLKTTLEDISSPKPLHQGQGGYIMGERAGSADRGKLLDAQLMKEAGRSDDEIWEQTKWWLGHPDGKPRFEVAHGDERFDPFDAWGDLYNERVINSPFTKNYDRSELIELVTPKGGKTKGQFDEGRLRMTVREDSPEEMLSVLRHETQHAIGGAEGFAPGGSLGGIQNYLNEIIRDQANPLIKKGKAGIPLTPEEDRLITKAMDIHKVLTNPYGLEEKHRRKVFTNLHKLYERLADESQARLVQSRAHMTQEAMDADPFYKRYPVSPENMIIRERR